MTTAATGGGPGVLAGEERLLIDGELAADGTPADFDRAIAIANDTIFGLAGQVSSGDEHALAVALKRGLGRRYGDGGFEEYLEIKAIGLPT
jgi:hypothetical protein